MELLVMDSEISGLLEFTVATLMTSPFLFADELLVTLVMTALDVVLLQMMLYVVYGHVSSWKCFFTTCAPYQSDPVTGSSALPGHRGSLPESAARAR